MNFKSWLLIISASYSHKIALLDTVTGKMTQLDENLDYFLSHHLNAELDDVIIKSMSIFFPPLTHSNSFLPHFVISCLLVWSFTSVLIKYYKIQANPYDIILIAITQLGTSRHFNSRKWGVREVYK